MYTKEQQTRHRRRVKKQRERTRIPPSVAEFIWERDQGCCVRCGKHYTQVWTMEIAHIIPRSSLGEGVPQNLALLCGPSVNTGTCHNIVDYTRSGREWFKEWAENNLDEQGNRRC